MISPQSKKLPSTHLYELPADLGNPLPNLPSSNQAPAGRENDLLAIPIALSALSELTRSTSPLNVK